MSEAVLLKPDREFIDRIVESGGEHVKQCMQCATCAVVCELSPAERPFPRKEMLWAQWGLKDRLVADPDLWLCHQCNDCSTQCPRGAHPGDVLAAVRQQCVIHYATPRFLARWMANPRYLPLILVIPSVLLALALVARDSVAAGLGLPGEEALYARLFPHWLLIGFFSSLSALVFLAALRGVLRFWHAMQTAGGGARGKWPGRGLVPSLWRAVWGILTHSQFTKCIAQRPRYLAHLGVFYGFVALFIATIWAVVVLYVLRPLFPGTFEYPFGFLNPVKIFANFGALALAVGAGLMLRERLRTDRGAAGSTSSDWLLPGVLCGVALTGLAVEALRFVAAPSVAYPVYFVHLVLVFALLVYLPYSKLAHLIYRTAALTFAEYTGRNTPLQAGPPVEPKERKEK